MNSRSAMPKSRSEQIVVQELSNETLVYDLERHKVHCLNSSAAYVWRRCDGRTAIADVARSLEEEFGLPADARIINLAIDDLRRARLLDDRATPAAHGASRRDTLKRIGIAAGLAVLVPAVTSIVAPTAALAFSGCRTQGQTCTPTQLCCQGLLCKNGTCVLIGT